MPRSPFRRFTTAFSRWFRIVSAVRRPHSFAFWSGLGWLILLAGLGVSLVSAAVWRAQVRAEVDQSFSAEAAGVGSAVTTALLRMDDLTVAARGLIGSDRGLTNRKLANWYTSVGAVQRYPGIIGFGYVRFVPASQLPSFTAQLRADPVPGLALRAGPIKLEPSGRRPYYCLARLGLAGAVNQFLLSPGIDYCAIAGFSGLQSARDADQFVSFTLGGKIVAVFAPIYQGGTSPATIALRRARIVGVVAELFDVRNILGQALAGHRELQVSVAARGLPPSPAASTGIAGQFAASVAPLSSIASIGPVTHGGLRKQLMIAADGGWVVTIAKPSNGF